MRDPRREAFDRLGGRYEVRVLEPSPPAITEPPWMADDPTVRGDVPEGRLVVSPVSSDDLIWDDLCRQGDDDDLAGWCAERWLGAWRRLPPLEPGWLDPTIGAWHALVEHVLAPARYAETGKIGLRWTCGGVGTPFFGADHQLRLAGADLFVDGRPKPVTTVRAAAEAAGVAPGAPTDVYTPATALDLDAPLAVDTGAAALLGDWFGLACSVLEELRARHWTTDQPSRVQLWPEHFDLSVELGDEAAGRRAGFGASPGDEGHPLPYLYVVPWSPQPAAPIWNDGSFAGASLSYEALADAADQRATALTFFQAGLDRL